EGADGLARLGDLGPLAGDLRELVGGLLDAVLVRQRLADAHVNDDLLQPRQAKHVRPAQLRLQLGDDLFLIPILQTGHGPPRFSISRHAAGREARGSIRGPLGPRRCVRSDYPWAYLARGLLREPSPPPPFLQ